MKQFRASNGRIYTGDRLSQALAAVAADLRESAHAIRREDNYASHVTEAQKEANLVQGLAYADRAEAGEVRDLTFLQRLNHKLTGECPALMP